MAQNQQTGAFDIPPASSGPFSEFLNPAATVAPTWNNGQPPSGFEHKEGQVAYLGSKLLQGITDGRVKAYAAKEQKRLQTWQKVTAQYNAVQNDPDVDPQIKADIRKQYYQMLGSVGQEQIRESKATKNKGAGGHIAGVLNSVFEKLSGGPIKGDALTVEKMADFMASTSKAVQGGASASNAYQNQFSLIQQGIDAAKKNVTGQWKNPTREEILAQPQTRQALSWFQQYAPSQLPIATDMIGGYPSQTNLKERAGVELATGAPPATQPSAAPPQAPPATPPVQFTGTRPPSSAVVPPQIPGGPPLQVPQASAPPVSAAPPQTQAKSTPAQQEEDEWRQQLSQWAGVQQDVPIFNAAGDIVGYGPKATAAAISERNRMVNANERAAQTEADKKTAAAESARRWEAARNTAIDHWNANHTNQERVQARLDAEFAYRQTRDAKVLSQARSSEEKALNDFVADATSKGHPFGAVADNLDDYLSQYGPDTDIGKNQAYIRGQIASIKNKQAGGSWTAIMQSLGGGAAPPATTKPASTAPPATDSKSKVDAAKSALGLQ